MTLADRIQVSQLADAVEEFADATRNLERAEARLKGAQARLDSAQARVDARVAMQADPHAHNVLLRELVGTDAYSRYRERVAQVSQAAVAVVVDRQVVARDAWPRRSRR